jgi:hypothetical protein
VGASMQLRTYDRLIMHIRAYEATETELVLMKQSEPMKEILMGTSLSMCARSARTLASVCCGLQ